MSINFRKYILKPLSLALVMSFLFSNIALCKFIIDNCKPQMSSCCCKQAQDFSKEIKFEKPCCCEIKEATDRTAEATTVLYQIQNKDFSKDIQHQIAYNLNHNDNFDLNYRPLSFHSPPDTDLNILNSVFRI